MEYQVSEKIQSRLSALTENASVQKALAFMKEDQDKVIEKQIELTLIPAPTYHEEKKAARLLEMFKEEGLTDCHIDEYGNCVGIRKGTGGGKTTLVEGHMDTVFPLDTELKIVREDGYAVIESSVWKEENGKFYWGAGVDEDIIQSSINALVAALNNYFAQ